MSRYGGGGLQSQEPSGGRGPATPAAVSRPHRFPVRTQRVVPRSPDAVWDEYATDHHPAWSDQPACDDPTRAVGTLTGMRVGATRVAVLPASHSTGVRGVLLTEITEVVVGARVTSSCLVTGSFEQTETIEFSTIGTASTLVTLTYWVDTVPVPDPVAARLQRNLTRLQEGYLARAAVWVDGAPHRPNLVPREADAS